VRKAVFVANAQHQIDWATAFSSGLNRHGWQTTIRPDAAPADLLVLWGTRRQEAIAAQKWQGGEVCILERGYIGDRFKWSSVSFGGKLNGRATFRGVRSDPARFKADFGDKMQPWQAHDGYALLIGQVAGDMSLQAIGGDLVRWYRETAAMLQKHGYDVRFRPHPGTIRRGSPLNVPPGAKLIDGTLKEAFAGAAVVVTFNSNTGVESVLAGVPTITSDVGSMAWDVSSHDVALPLVTPNRDRWAAELAWKQWTLEEMASGACWEAVGI
jgi:hypothetical protein